MQPLAPIDAIGPAVSRTRELLFRDFRLLRFLKVALVATIAEGMGSGTGFNYGSSLRPGRGPQMPHLPPEQIHLLLIGAIVAGAIILPLSLAFLYLSARFTFVNFDMVLFRRPLVRPGWQALRGAGNRYFGLRILLALLALAVLLLCGIALFPGFRIAMHDGGWSRLISTALVIAPFFLVYSLAMMLFQSFAATYVVPRMALENASLSDSLAGGWRDLQGNFGRFLIYFLLRGAISLAIIFLCFIVLVICVAVLALLIAGIVFALYHFLWGGGYAAKALVIAVGGLLVIALLTGYLTGVVAVGGFRNVFRQAYALLFYGGYYPALGNLLSPSAAPAAGPETTRDLPPQAVW